MKALVITAEPETVVVIETDGNLLDWLHKSVGGYFDVISLHDPAKAAMYVHDEGLLNGMPRNRVATQLVYGSQDAHTLEPSPGVISLYEGPLYVAGNAVILSVDSGGNSRDVPTPWIAAALATLKKMQAS